MKTKHLLVALLVVLVLLASYKILILGAGFILGVLFYNTAKGFMDDLTKDPWEEPEDV